jgi:tetratricopeptide (TPR) repeat protein
VPAQETALKPPLKQRYQRAEVLRMLHLSERQLQAWLRAGLIQASDDYTFRDLIAIRTLRELRAQRMALPEIRRALDALRRLPDVGDPLADLKISVTGRRITVRVAGQSIEAVTGQILFDFDSTTSAGVQPLQPAPPPRRERESDVSFQKGLMLEETGAPVEEAVAAYRHAVECNPHAAGALVNLGTIYYRLRRFEEARKHYEQALEADADYPLAHFNLGNLYDESGDLAHARQCYENALRLNPRYGDAHFNLALLAERTGDALRAVHHWKAYLKIDNASSWSDIARRQLEKLRVALLS